MGNFKTKFILVLLSLMLLLFSIVLSQPPTDFDITKHLSTKTPYYQLNNGSGDYPQPPESCSLVHIDFLARHGSRNPVESAIQKLAELTTALADYKDQIKPEFQWVLNWTVPYKLSVAGNLIFQGQLEHYEISRRMLANYPQFFSTYEPETYTIRSTAISRTGISASSFTYGIFQGTGNLGDQGFEPVFIESSSLDQDFQLRFFDNCPAYNQMKQMDLINDKQQKKFEDLIYPNISLDISNRLGLSSVWDPSNSVISNIFSACAYDISINNVTDKWCSLLSPENILAWEYSQDLSNYWQKSYGNEFNYKISSVLLQDMIQTFDMFVNDTEIAGSNLTTLRFGHAETIIPFIALLGLYKDNYTLTYNLTQDQIDNRLFRTSVISPYASNVGFFLYDCGDSFKLRVDHNELPIQIPGCDDIFCDYTQFRNIFIDVVNFNFTSYCTIPPSPSSSDESHETPSPSPRNNTNSHSTSSDSKDDLDKERKEAVIYLGVFIPFAFIVGGLFGFFGTLFIRNRDNKSINSYTAIPS
eukprot:gene8292-10188_t